MTSIPLAAAFNPRDNALNLLRLVLASMVIFGHAAPLGGYELPRTLHLLFLEVAVDGFFGLSGFLITRSWDRRPVWGRFLWHRALRILPGFWACLVVTAFVFGPIGTWLSGSPQSSYWQASDGPGSYIWNNFWLRIGQFGISSGPSDVPYPEVWNGSLWSLYWEFLCYLGIAALGVTGLLLGRRMVVVALTAAVWLVTVAPVFENTDSLVGQNSRWSAGSCLIGSVASSCSFGTPQ